VFFKPLKTQQLTESVYVVRTLISNFYIYTDGENTVWFDTGYLPAIIKRELRKINIKMDYISHIFLTHSDYDHVGGIKLFKNGKVYLSVDEEKMITFKKPRGLLFFNKKIRGKYQLLNWLQNMNTAQQKESIKKLLKIDNIKLIFTGHTGYLKK